jgi:hypothetical protein
MTRPKHDPGFLLFEALAALAVLAVASLFLARALADALSAANSGANRLREAALRQLATDPDSLAAADGQWRLLEVAPPPPGWPTSNDARRVPPCWRRITALAPDFVWIEARCGVRRKDLPATAAAPGLLVPR